MEEGGLIGPPEPRTFEAAEKSPLFPSGAAIAVVVVSEALHTDFDPGFILTPMPAAAVKGFAEPMVTYAVEGRSADRRGRRNDQGESPRVRSTVKSRPVC